MCVCIGQKWQSMNNILAKTANKSKWQVSCRDRRIGNGTLKRLSIKYALCLMCTSNLGLFRDIQAFYFEVGKMRGFNSLREVI